MIWNGYLAKLKLFITPIIHIDKGNKFKISFEKHCFFWRY